MIPAMPGFNSINQFIQKILNNGTWNTDDEIEITRYRIRNSLASGALVIVFFIIAITTFLLLTKSYSVEFYFLTNSISAGFAFYAFFLLYLNNRGYVNGFLWSIAIFNPSYLTFACMLFGPVIQLEYLIIAGLPISFMTSNPKYKRSLIVSATMHIAMFFVASFYNLNYQALIELPKEAYTSGPYISRIVVTLTIFLFILFFYNLLNESERKTQNARKKSDELLLNIFPEKIVRELKLFGRSKPKRIHNASVLFTDFVGFTKIAEKFTAEEVVDELDRCFSYFDKVTEKYNLEKLKTIGDNFMAAGGIPEANKTHAIDCCLAALEIQAFMDQMKVTKAQAGFPYWELRLGINSGGLVAGVVGEKKFAYDVWGDTVNTASRMESSGEKGKINLSIATYELVKTFFDCEYRGKVSAKGKGEIDMYFLTGLKSKYCADTKGRKPNEKFLADFATLATKN